MYLHLIIYQDIFIYIKLLDYLELRLNLLSFVVFIIQER